MSISSTESLSVAVGVGSDDVAGNFSDGCAVHVSSISSGVVEERALEFGAFSFEVRLSRGQLMATPCPAAAVFAALILL